MRILDELLGSRVVELQVEAVGQDGGGAVGKDKLLLSAIPCVHELIADSLGRNGVVGGKETAYIHNGLIACDAMVVGCLDGDGAAVGVAQHVCPFLTVFAIADQPGLVERIVDGLRRIAKRQRMGRSNVWHVVIFYRLMVGELAIAGNLSECKRQYPLLEVLRGFTLIDNAIDLHVAGTDKRLAIGDGEFGQRLPIGHRLAMATCDDAGINPVENALSTDRIVVEHGLSTLQQLLVLLCRQSSTNPYAVFHLRFIADSVQRTVVNNRLISRVAQYARGRTVVNEAGAACITIDKRCNTVLSGTVAL